MEKNEKKENKEKEKIEDIEKIGEIEEKDKIIVIKLDENLKKHIKDKNFILDNKWKLNLEILYDKISQKKPLNNLDILYDQSYATFPYDNLVYIFFFKLIQVEFKFIYKEESENKTDKFFICSTCELLDYCKKNNYIPYIELDNNKYEFKCMFDSISHLKFAQLDNIILIQDYRNYYDYKNESVTSCYPNENSKLEPEKLSKFFELFFKFQTKSDFDYWESKTRKNFISFILTYKTNKGLHCFKICGPSAIGKSMILFVISRYSNNFLYFNLKTLRLLKQKDDNVQIQNILIESCKYLNLNNNQINELSSLFKSNRNCPFFVCLKKIVQFLINNNILSVIIFDQFKNDSIDKEQYDEILLLISQQINKNVKLLICSSTNDKEIREECIKSWKSRIFFLSQLNEKNQNYYFYIDELYNKKKTGNNLYDNILYTFNYIPKYKAKFKYLLNNEGNTTQQLNKDLKEIKERVENNLKDLYRIINEKDKSESIIIMKMVESLRYLDLNINEQINYEKLEEFTRICSFKYYRFKFEQKFFKINYNFPYMYEIVNQIIDTHLEDFYKYKRKDEHSGTANSDFFELFSGKSLKNRKLELPESENTICVKVKEIVEMNEFSKNELDSSFNKEIYSHLEKYEVKKDDFIEENKEIEKELKGRNLLLNLKDIINYNCNDIEYNKLKYLNGLKKESIIFGNKNLGDMSVFINQKNQRGKTLDLAYVYGEKNAKIFIGFQMKAYDEELSHDCKFNSTKDNLKNALQPMLVNIKYLMGMNIKSWHYVVIILLDKRKEEGKQYFKKIVKTCINNGLEYIFYEPFENKFYNRYLENITKFIPNQFSNLDNSIETILPINIMDLIEMEKYMNNFNNYMINNNYNNTNYIEKGLTSLIIKKRKRTQSATLTSKIENDEIKNALNSILGNIKIKFYFNCIKFVGEYQFLKNTTSIPIPKIGYFFLIPSIEKDIYFIAFNKEREDKYFEYIIDYELDSLDLPKNLEIIKEVEANYIISKIDMKEKFYVFSYEENKKCKK